MPSRPSLHVRLCAVTVLCTATLLPSSAQAIFAYTYACQAQAISDPSWPAINFMTRSNLSDDALSRLIERNLYRGFKVTCNKVAG